MLLDWGLDYIKKMTGLQKYIDSVCRVVATLLTVTIEVGQFTWQYWQCLWQYNVEDCFNKKIDYKPCLLSNWTSFWSVGTSFVGGDLLVSLSSSFGHVETSFEIYAAGCSSCLSCSSASFEIGFCSRQRQCQIICGNCTAILQYVMFQSVQIHGYTAFHGLTHCGSH